MRPDLERAAAARKKATLAGMTAFAVTAALLGMTAGCGSPRPVRPVANPIPLGPEPAKGEVLFMRHCHACHPQGAAGLGPALNNKPLPADVIRLQVRKSVAGDAMPTFDRAQITDKELDWIIAYMMAIRHI